VNALVPKIETAISQRQAVLATLLQETDRSKIIYANVRLDMISLVSTSYDASDVSFEKLALSGVDLSLENRNQKDGQRVDSNREVHEFHTVSVAIFDPAAEMFKAFLKLRNKPSFPLAAGESQKAAT
jgi:hypothetical protein